MPSLAARKLAAEEEARQNCPKLAMASYMVGLFDIVGIMWVVWVSQQLPFVLLPLIFFVGFEIARSRIGYEAVWRNPLALFSIPCYSFLGLHRNQVSARKQFAFTTLLVTTFLCLWLLFFPIFFLAQFAFPSQVPLNWRGPIRKYLPK